MQNKYKENLDFFLAETFAGESLSFYRAMRGQMGAYLCIASNDVPPAVSKRVTLNINCKYLKRFYKRGLHS